MDWINLSSPHLEPISYNKEQMVVKIDNPLSEEHIHLFESKIQSFYGSDVHVTALNSGTSALHLALIALGVGYGDEVICQSMTFVASANPIVYLGATAVFVDSETATWNMCPVALEAAIKDRIAQGKNPKAIIVVDLYGMPYQFNQIRKIALKYSIPIIEDSAEALGSIYYGQKCGLLGDIGVLSFNTNKIITTGGGGALISKNKDLNDKFLYLATQAREKVSHYQHEVTGYNYRINPLAATLGVQQFECLENFINLRRKNNQMYVEFFKNITEVEVFVEPDTNIYSNHWLTAVLFESYKKREAIRLAFQNAKIETRPLWKPMHLQPVFERSPYYGEKVAENLFDRGLCLPSGSNINKAQKYRILEVLEGFFK